MISLGLPMNFTRRTYLFLLTGVFFLSQLSVYLLSLPLELGLFASFVYGGLVYGIFFYGESSSSVLPSLPEDSDLKMARRVQEALLSIEPPSVPSIRIAKRCVPAAVLGGDFYAFVSYSNHQLSTRARVPGVIEYVDHRAQYLGVTIGDVAGHGVSSALVMALSSGILNPVGHNEHSPAMILGRANNDIERFISNSEISHVTAFFGMLNTDTYTFTYAVAGHPAGFVLRASGDVEMLFSEGVFLGMFRDETYSERTLQLSKGDRLCLYTDGIMEAFDSQLQAFGVERLCQLALEYQGRSIDSFCDAVFNAVSEFTGSSDARDDQTFVVLEIEA